jgi:hypothetical protein
MSDIVKSKAFDEFLQKKCTSYAKNRLIETGIDFSKIEKNDLLMTCSSYGGIISKANYNIILGAINKIYERINCCEIV